MVGNYFSGSVHRFASFFTQEGNLNLTELEELKKLLEDQIKEKKEKSK
jgi:hypothetical protein